MAQDRALATAIRNFQRIKNEAQIQDYMDHFLQDLMDLCVHPPTGPGDDELPEWEFEVNEDNVAFKDAMKKYHALKEYFLKNWMSKQWLRMSTTLLLALFLTILVSVLDGPRPPWGANARPQQRKQLRGERLQGFRRSLSWTSEE